LRGFFLNAAFFLHLRQESSMKGQSAAIYVVGTLVLLYTGSKFTPKGALDYAQQGNPGAMFNGCVR
jgi:hypothetical protein